MTRESVPAGAKPADIRRRDPIEIWTEIARVLGLRAQAQALVTGDLAKMPNDPSEDEIDDHERRCSLSYAEIRGAGEHIGVLVAELAEAGLVDEIGQYLAVTYGGRP